MKPLITLFILFLSLSFGLNAQVFEEVWSTDRVLQTPESVMFDEARNQIYVSCINGKPLDKDNNGYIALLGNDGALQKLKWVTGLHAPKGMALSGDSLYVTDIDRFHLIDIANAKIIKTVDVPGSVFLNDMAVDDRGDVYISDMSKNQVLKYNGETVEVWLEGDGVYHPNGLAFFKGNLFVGMKDSIVKLDGGERKMKVVITETGPVDGLIPLGGNKFVISDWAGRIMQVRPDEKIILGNSTEQNIQAADLGYIPDEKLVLIPTFFDNRVVARRLP